MLFAAILGLCLCAALSNAATKPTTEAPPDILEKRILSIDQQPIDLESHPIKKRAIEDIKKFLFGRYNKAKKKIVKKKEKKGDKKKEDSAKNEDITEKEDTAKKEDTTKKEDTAKKEDAAKKDATKGDTGKAGNAVKPKTLLPDEADDYGTENLDLNLNKRSLDSLTNRIPDYGNDEAIEAESLDDIDDLI